LKKKNHRDYKVFSTRKNRKQKLIIKLNKFFKEYGDTVGKEFNAQSLRKNKLGISI
jgi:hypothetical protein